MLRVPIAGFVVTFAAIVIGQQAPGPGLPELLRANQFDLSTTGKAFLAKEAGRATFFLIGGLHGDKETPALVDALWPSLKDFGYRYITMEMSPWAASRLKVEHLRGGDIEEPQPHLLIRVLADANPQNHALQSLVELTKSGYRRPLAPSKINLGGLHEFDQRKDDPAFAFLASVATYPATVFDLRPIRRALHQIPVQKLSARDAGLLFWADSYDAIVSYREVTPGS